jgi:hypothetical protein
VAFCLATKEANKKQISLHSGFFICTLFFGEASLTRPIFSEEGPPDMETSWEYIEQAVANSRQGVVLEQKDVMSKQKSAFHFYSKQSI